MPGLGDHAAEVSANAVADIANYDDCPDEPRVEAPIEPIDPALAKAFAGGCPRGGGHHAARGRYR